MCRRRGQCSLRREQTVQQHITVQCVTLVMFHCSLPTVPDLGSEDPVDMCNITSIHTDLASFPGSPPRTTTKTNCLLSLCGGEPGNSRCVGENLLSSYTTLATGRFLGFTQGIIIYPSNDPHEAICTTVINLGQSHILAPKQSNIHQYECYYMYV